jgi:hypothetical protein
MRMGYLFERCYSCRVSYFTMEHANVLVQPKENNDTFPFDAVREQNQSHLQP